MLLVYLELPNRHNRRVFLYESYQLVFRLKDLQESGLQSNLDTVSSQRACIQPRGPRWKSYRQTPLKSSLFEMPVRPQVLFAAHLTGG